MSLGALLLRKMIVEASSASLKSIISRSIRRSTLARLPQFENVRTFLSLAEKQRIMAALSQFSALHIKQTAGKNSHGIRGMAPAGGIC
jgi:hypothetical protein